MNSAILEEIRGGNWTDDLFSAWLGTSSAERVEIQREIDDRKLLERFRNAVSTFDSCRGLTKIEHRAEAVGSDKGTSVPERKKPRLIWGAELEAMDIPPIRWIVPDLLPVGLCVLGAPFKYYKSFLVLDLCMAVASGGRFLGRKANKSLAVYGDFESTERRPRTRALLMSEHIPDGVAFQTVDALEVEDGRRLTIGNGFEEYLTDILETNREIKLFVIDVLQCIRPRRKGNVDPYAADYAELRPLKRIAEKFEVCILAVHHTRKLPDADPFNQLGGSVGLMGSVDAGWVITKNDRFEDEATLSITGRDLETRQLAIRWDKAAFRWRLIGDADVVEEERREREFRDNPITRTVDAVVTDAGGEWKGTLPSLIEMSRYSNSGDARIYDTPRAVGQYLKAHAEDFHHYLKVSFGSKKTNHGFEYVIHKKM